MEANKSQHHAEAAFDLSTDASSIISAFAPPAQIARPFLSQSRPACKPESVRFEKGARVLIHVRGNWNQSIHRRTQLKPLKIEALMGFYTACCWQSLRWTQILAKMRRNIP